MKKGGGRGEGGGGRISPEREIKRSNPLGLLVQERNAVEKMPRRMILQHIIHVRGEMRDLCLRWSMFQRIAEMFCL